MYRSIVAAAFLLSATAPVPAQNLESLRQAFEQLPETILSNPEPVQAYFADPRVLLELANRQGGELTPRIVGRARLGAALRPLDALHTAGLQDWNEKAGIPLEKIKYFAGFGQEPHKVVIWGLGDSAAAIGLVEALAGRSFVPVGAEGVLGNGKPLAMDPARRDPGNPWRSKVGAATFVAAKGAAVIQSTTPDPMPKLLSNAPSAGSASLVMSALAGLEGAIADHAVVQAMLISPVLGMASIDPGLLLTPQADNLDALRETLAAQIEAGSEGIPPYFGGIIADAHIDHPVVAISLAYADCETAETAAKLMKQRWIETMPEQAQGTVSAGSVPSPDDLCAATLTIVSDTTDAAANPAFNALFSAFLRRSFTVLQIGKS